MCGYQSAGTVDARLEFRARGTSSRYVSGRFLTITVHPTHALCPGKTRFNLEKKTNKFKPDRLRHRGSTGDLVFIFGRKREK